jgi:hypothetical protein
LELASVLGVVALSHRRRLRLLLELQGHLRLNLGARAPRHAGLRMLRRVLRHLVLRPAVRHHHVRLRSHRLLWVLRMLSVRRRRLLVL